MLGDMLQEKRRCTPTINSDLAEHMSGEPFTRHAKHPKSPTHRGSQGEEGARNDIEEAMAEVVHLGRKKFGKTLRGDRGISSQCTATQKDSERKRERKYGKRYDPTERKC